MVFLKNRYLFWFCISFVLATALCAVCGSTLELLLTIGFAVSVSVFVLCRADAKVAASLLVIGLSFSLIWQSLYFSNDKLPKALLESESEILMTVVSFPEDTSSDGVSFCGKAYYEDKEIKILVYTSDLNETLLLPGDVISARTKVYEFENTEFFAEKTYYKSRYIDCRAFVTEFEYIEREEHSKFRYFPQYAANHLKNKLEILFSKEHAAFIKSLIFGDKSSLDDEFKKDIRKSGMSHATAVSGLHISIIVAFIIFFTKNKYLKLLAIPAMFIFAFMVGASQSAIRAVIMQSLAIISHVEKREYDSLTSVSIAAFVLVLINPYCVTDVSFILSFAATFGIILLHQKIFPKVISPFKDIRGWIRKFINVLVSAFAVTVSAILFTMPITSYTFSAVSLISPLSNVLLSIPITVVFTGGIIVLFLGEVFLPLGKVAAFVLSFMVEVVVKSIRAFAKMPYSEVFTGDRLMILAIFYLCIVAVYTILAGGKKIRPFVATAICVLSILVVITVRPNIVSEIEYDGIRFDVLDVGQGQCVVATADDTCVVIDCGGDKDSGSVAINHLLNRGIDEIDALILTHAHSDHVNGAEYLTETIDTSSVYMPSKDKENADFIDISENIDDDGKVYFLEEDKTLSFGEMKVSILTLEEGRDENENGLVVIISDGDYDTLITGDIPSSQEKLILSRIPDCESYIAGHHGSKSSSSLALLNKALPELCVISVGKGNSYGHPNGETLERFEKIGAEVYRTDLEGAITFFSGQVKENDG